MSQVKLNICMFKLEVRLWCPHENQDTIYLSELADPGSLDLPPHQNKRYIDFHQDTIDFPLNLNSLKMNESKLIKLEKFKQSLNSTLIQS